MTFNILVCIKQVPDTNDIKWTANNTIDRAGMDLIINPYDMGAMQIALDVKKAIVDAKITLLSMGPTQAVESLSYGLAMGADEAFLLCDKKFAGSDTLATSYCLECFIRKFMPDFNLILCGQQAVDGDTAQVPPALAQKLCVPSSVLVCEFLEYNDGKLTLKRETPCIKEEIEIKTPALLAVNSRECMKKPLIEDFMRAQDIPVKILSAADIGADDAQIGFAGSPTIVKKAFRPEITRECRIINDFSPEAAAKLLLEAVKEARS